MSERSLEISNSIKIEKNEKFQSEKRIKNIEYPSDFRNSAAVRKI